MLNLLALSVVCQTLVNAHVNVHATPHISNEARHREETRPSGSHLRQLYVFPMSTKDKSFELEDADADDYYIEEYDVQYDDEALTSNVTTTTTKPGATMTPWYTLSHYIPPDSVLYDSIEGFLIAILFCLMCATCYNYCYYCCLTRCGLCPDDRIYQSLLNSKGRKRRRKAIPKRRRLRRVKDRAARGGNCCSNLFCGCCCGKDDEDYGQDGKGFFVPLSSTNIDGYSSDDSDRSRDSDSDSSLSHDSGLSLEYGGEDYLNDEYGENTDRLTANRVEVAAKEFFAKEERQRDLEQGKRKSRTPNRNRSAGARSLRSRRSGRSNRSVRSRGGRSRGGSTVRSQTSSILSSSSENSFSSGGSMSSEGDHSIEMEEAMMDLKLAEQRINSASDLAAVEE